MFLSIFYWSLITNFITNYTLFNGMTNLGNRFYLCGIGGLSVVNNDFFVEKYYSYFDGLSSNYLTDLSFDKDTNLWIGTKYGGLIYFDLKKEIFSSYLKEKIPNEININQIAIENDTIILATDKGLYIIDTKGSMDVFSDDTLIKIEYPKIPTNNIFTVKIFDDIWLGTNRGVSQIKKNLRQINNFLKPLGDTVKSIIKANDTIFILTELGIAYFDNNRFYPYFRFSAPLIVYDFTFYQNSFYLGTENGFFVLKNNQLDTLAKEKTIRFYLKKGDSILYAICRGWSPNIIGFIYELKDTIKREIWFNSIYSKVVYNAIFDQERNLYLTHYLTYWANRKISVVKPDNTIILLNDSLINPNFLVSDSKNQIWIGHWALNGGLSCYSPYENLFRIYRWGEESYKNVIGGLGIDHYDTKWMRNAENIIALDILDNYYEFNIPNLGGISFSNFAFDKKNRVYLGTLNGLLIIDHKNTLNIYGDDEIKIITTGLLSPIINSCCCDRKGRIWVATPNGAGLLKDNLTFELFTTQNSGLLSNEVYFVNCDKYNRIWFLTKEGISIYHPEKKRWKIFNEYFLPNWEKKSNFYRSLYINDYLGEVLIATEDGLVRFYYPEEPIAPFKIYIYPNPIIKNENNVSLKIGGNIPQDVKLKIYNFLGKLIAKGKDFKKDGNEFIINIDQKFKGGLYFLVIEIENEKFIEKFVVLE